MKKFIAALLVLTMVFTLATTAMAACKFEPGDLAVLKEDANAYSKAKSGEKTKNVRVIMTAVQPRMAARPRACLPKRVKLPV